MDATTILKAEIKAWERDFRAQNGRTATVEDIKALPHVAEKYKLYKKITKETGAKNVQQNQILERPKTPPPRMKQTNSTSPVAILRKSRPEASTTAAATTNPFSPVKRKAGGVGTSSSHMNPFLTPVKDRRPPSRDSSPPSPTPSLAALPAPAISKARKRLHGEPVSPSPKPRDKRRRLEAAVPTTTKNERHLSRSQSPSSPVEEGSSFVDESPVKAPASGKAFTPLFQEASTHIMTPTSRGMTSKEDTNNRSKTFTRAKTMPGGLFRAAKTGKDTQVSLNPNIFKGDNTMLSVKTTGSEKMRDGYGGRSQKSGKKRNIPGPWGLIPGKDDLSEVTLPPPGSSSTLTSHNVSASRKRSLSDASRDGKKIHAMSNPWDLLPPSPPPADGNQWQNSGRKVEKGKNIGVGKSKKAKISYMDSDEEGDMDSRSANDSEVKVVAWRGYPQSIHSADEDDDVLELQSELLPFRTRKTKGQSPPNSPRLEKFEIDVPEDMRRVLALPLDDREREREEEELVKGLVKGLKMGVCDVWGPGEIGGEDRESDGYPRTEDDWEGEGVPWEVAEL